MPYHSKAELPDQVKDNLPSHAQEIYKEAFNNAFDRFKDPDKRKGDASREEASHKVAWNAVEQEYHKEDGKWKRN